MRTRSRPVPFWLLVVMGVAAGLFFVLTQQPPAPAAPPSIARPTQADPASLATLPAEQRIPTSVAPDIPAETALLIPSAGLYAPIVQVYLDGVSWDISNLGRNAGYLQGTALPGQPGNLVLSGHVEMADGSAGPFAGLKQVQLGDIVEVTQQGETWRYAVTEIVTTTPDALEYIYPTPDDRLTLITCGTYDFLSNAYPDRLIVIASRVS